MERQRKNDEHKDKHHKKERTGQALKTKAEIQRQRGGEYRDIQRHRTRRDRSRRKQAKLLQTKVTASRGNKDIQTETDRKIQR